MAIVSGGRNTRHALSAWLRSPVVDALRPVVVGVVNVTPDSFSDGGRYLDPIAAMAHVDRLLAEGADVVEIGGESTRPAGGVYGRGAAPVDAATQLARVLPVIRHASARGALVSIDTTLPEVASAAIDAGARIVNDVSLLSHPALASVVSEHEQRGARGVWLVLMHSRPGATSVYEDVVADVGREWCAARDVAVARGVDAARIVLDPGIGFGKGAPESWRLLSRIDRLVELGHPVYVGPSRKSSIAAAEEQAGMPRSAPDDRLGGTLAACIAAARKGAVALRVHDVLATRQALAVAAALGDLPSNPIAPSGNGREAATRGVA